jgi:hypothetical protein
VKPSKPVQVHRIFAIVATLCLVGCTFTRSVKTSVEVTGGSTTEAKQAIADSAVSAMAHTLIPGIARSLPSVNPNTFNGLRLNINTHTFHQVGGETTTRVYLECIFTHDGSVEDKLQNQIIDACKVEIQHALEAKSSV